MTAKIVEGKGSILPGAPKGSGPIKVESDRVASYVDYFIRQYLDKSQRRLIKIYYLESWRSVEDRASKLRLPARTLYDHLHKIHELLAQKILDQDDVYKKSKLG